ncbi:MAG: SMC family ATPase [Nanoarchaeota archaeon]|nr:SMC family ATPase [Nanoarchaeota archaeon]
MKLVSLYMKNVRSHKDTDIIFRKGITVINGKTGSGKSSILMAVDYALFGSANLGNNEIMRRGAKHMLIRLCFNHNNKDYTIIRGLKRGTGSATVDVDNLKVLESNKQLNILSRANDINQIITEILGIPDNVKASQMFQVTSYTKQDEIRTLIEMRKEERQDYIDKILQLSRYKNTFENLKGVLSHFNNKIKEIERVEEFVNKEREEFNKLKVRIQELDKSIKENRIKEEVLSKALKEKQKEKEKINTSIEDIKKTVVKEKDKKSRKEELIKQLEANQRVVKSLKDEIKGLKPLPEGLKDLEAANNELTLFETIINVNKNKIKELEDERKAINSLGAKCPTCRQEMNESHKNKIISSIGIKIEELEKEKTKAENDLKKLKQQVILLKKHEEVSNKIENYNKVISGLKEEADKIILNDIKSIEENYEDLEMKLKQLIDKDKELFSKHKSVSDIIVLLEKDLKSSNQDLSVKNETIKNYEKEASNKPRFEYLIKFINNLRDYVKEIRTVIRQKFLTDFRNEFQHKFEEIRSQEEEYSVDIGLDYEPTAYTTSGEKVPVSYLSGGEKTSVALAYRLALSDLAAQMSNVVPSELLILDEPTTGFDNEDVKSLPEALKNISSIPQIIIVTHQLILKDIADNIIDIKKKGNDSIVECL